MRQVILDFPKQFRVGAEAAKKILINPKKHYVNNIIICGMGGSSLPGSLLKITAENLKITNLPIVTYRNYDLPIETKRDSLIICVSYSGNTEETISSFREARKRNLKTAVIASDGKLITLAKREKVPFVRVPGGIQPRCALGYQFAALVELLYNLRVIKNIKKDLISLEKTLNPKKLEAEGKKIAKSLKDAIPIVYSSGEWGVLAKIWKIKFNENSKIPAFFNIFPELNHNEMIGVGETHSKKIKNILKVIILRDKKGDKRISKRIDVTSNIFKQKGIKVIFVEIKGKTFFEKLFSTILLGDWASYYLALSQNIDPTPVKLVEDFKKRIAK